MILEKIRPYPIEKHSFLLLLCPFCGGEAQLMGTRRSSGILTYFVRCSFCKASSDFAHTQGLTVEKWNRRTA